MKDPEERKESDATVFPRFSYTLPKLPPKPNKKEKGKKEKQVRFPEASSSGHEERTDTHEASAGKSGSRLADLFRSAREIYSAGPRGEGQKIWSGIRKKKRAQKQAAKQHQLQIIRENPQPQAYGSPTPFTPARPSPPPPLGVSRGRSSPRPKHAHVPLTPHSLAGAGYYSQSGYSIPVAASASVQYDGQEVVVDGYKPLPPVPKLDAAPKNRDEVRERKTPSPPPPPPPRPVPSKNPERVIRQQVGTTSSTTAPQPQSRTQWFSELDDQQTERPRRTPQRKEPGRLRRFFSLFLNIEEPSDPHAGAATNHHPAKKHSKLKAQISHPGPMAVLDNRTVNVAVENGGVGGPAAAISLPLRNGEIVQPRRHAAQGKKGKGKQKRLTPPPPVAQSESPASDSKILDSSSSKAKDHGASKEKPSHCWRDMLLTSPSRPYSDSKVPSGSKPQSKPHAGLKEKPSHRWRDMLTSPGEHGGKSFYSGLRETERGWGRRRKSSDVSFACQGIISSALCADYPSHPDYPVMNPYASAAQYHGQQQARGGGIARANAIRDPGPSSQTQTQIHNQRYEFEDRDAVVAPLFCGIGGTMASNGGGDRIRDTRFYQAYDDVLGEYEKN
ncbi:hypothetical protein BU26DRAFT_524373 [Trematosphaeria pertusa]|uniref:Uncharacterized protein n=1 Tax=Trematosphaeria pertusa TaxID=390896 RepID=A0A6A6HY49_9PLEO|nr:uncharacterized protein BU26DRAFT_524373 [Trematosphaeria pertusa]KAF2242809.1 hypothetical protein BU26DRAFT_524373 [Trematosphaeria pertusa]